ncbi:GrpE nucleotide exchange factor protein [Dioscorea alata]|uniref:GrpE nucleotide exchange factor protein n=1 Tax=Dioscorea alata TaxID=55571 RepID=A0ACB7VJG9_DIOAL|nr:GrpE nucleotide exchange factor protein [Dioscorea alata]
MASRVLARLSSCAISARHCLISGSAPQGPLASVSNGFHSLSKWNSNSLSKFFCCEMNMQKECLYPASVGIQRCMFSSSASSQPTDKDSSQTNGDLDDVSADRNQAEPSETNANFSAPKKAEDASQPFSKKYEPQSGKRRRRRRGPIRTAFSDSDTEHELSKDDLVKLLAKKKELLKVKHEEFEKMQDKVLRSYVEMENVLDRTKREAENAKKFAIQNFAKSLLDVADNLGRASLVVKESFLKVDSSKDSAGAVPLLKTLLEGVEMTDKQLADVLKKFGVEKYDPINEHFDPNRHNAVFQVPDSSKPSDTVAAVLKPGYMLYDRVLRPAEVGVTQTSEEMAQ